MIEDVSRAVAKSALVLGANSGIGAACVNEFVAHNWSVIAGFHKRHHRIEALARESPPGCVTTMSVDVTDTATLASLNDHCVSHAIHLDAIIVAASYNEARLWNLPPLDATIADLLSCFTVEVGGLHNTLRLLRSLLTEGAAVVAFSSASALHGDDDTFVYNLSKTAVASYVRMVAKHYGSHIRLNCIAPDSISTDWLTEWDITPQELEHFRVKRAGARRIGDAQEVAALAFYLCSPQASFLNGQTITLDGGAG